jgi:hypothetical protein
MASGKSVELQLIQRPKGDPICIKPGCGLPWSAHVKKRPNKAGYHERLAKFSSIEHRWNGTFISDAPPKLTKAEHKRAKRRKLGKKPWKGKR